MDPRILKQILLLLSAATKVEKRSTRSFRYSFKKGAVGEGERQRVVGAVSRGVDGREAGLR